jgi:hypothetical protein
MARKPKAGKKAASETKAEKKEMAAPEAAATGDAPHSQFLVNNRNTT